MTTVKRTICFLLALVMVGGMFPASVLHIHAAENSAITEQQDETPAALENASPVLKTDADLSANEENEMCAVHNSGQVLSVQNDELLAGDQIQTLDIGTDTEEMRYANSDCEAYSEDWCYGIDADNGNLLYRQGYDFTDKQYLSKEPVQQITFLDGFLYVLFERDGLPCIARMDEAERGMEVLCTSDTEIQRFAVTGDTLFYLTAETIYQKGMDSAQTQVLLQIDHLSRFWLASESVLEYIAGDDAIIHQYELVTGETFTYENLISNYDEMAAGGTDISTQGLSLSGMRSKFPHGKYWNHAGNPGAENSKNNQDSYTSSPCTVHHVVGTSKQTCNGFQPGSTQLSWQCMGYAEKLGYDATGYNPRVNANGWYTYTSSSALNNLKAGDIVRYKSNEHSIYVIGVNGDTVTYTDCNSSGTCNIRWDATISKSTLRSTFTHVRSAPTGLNPEPVSCTCSTSYAGNYTCTTSSANLNMRSGHGTGYSIVASIPSGATVYVSKASGSGSGDWAHVEYNGYSGYASMQYLTKQSATSSRSSVISSWLSDSEMGNSISSIRTGEWLYLCYKVYDKNSGDMFDTYNTDGYTVTMNLYGPSGGLEHTATYSQDNSWIAIRRSTPGTYRGEVTFKFNSGGTTTVETSITMVYEPRVTPSPSDVNLNVLGVNTEKVTISYSGATNSSSVYLNASTTGNCFTYSWGSWSNDTMPLTITGTRAGTGTITVNLRDGNTNEQLASAVINVYVEAPSYTVSYNANGGSGAPSSQTKDYGVSLTLSSTVPTRFGYNFKGWATSSSATSASYQPGGSYTSNSGTTLYAVWNAAEELSGNYGKYSRNPSIAYGGQGVYFKFIPNASTYYRFYATGDTDNTVYLYDASGTQLATDDDSGGNRQFLLEYSLTANQTYYIYVRLYSSTATGSVPFSIAKRYTISYNANGGSGAPSAQYKYFDFDLILSSTVPTRSGYTFLGWATSSSATEAEYQPGDTYTQSGSNVTLYAVWSQNRYTVSYNANGGTGAPSSQTKTGGTALTLSTTLPTRFGYTFLGWGTSSSATSATYLPGGSFTTDANTTLYAVWQSASTISSGVTSSSYSATVSFANGYKYYSFTPSFSGKIQFESSGSSDTIIYLYDASGNQIVSNDDGGADRNFLLTYAVTSGTKYYVQVRYYGSTTGTISFTAKRAYDITYNANGGSGTPSAQVKVHGTSLTLSTTTPTRSGYTFLGWATSSTATSATYQPGGSFTSNADTTLYAVWKANTYTITYNANGGSGAPSDQIKNSGTALTLSTTLPTRFGYTFLGWSTSATATSATYLPGGSFTTDADTTLYAVWQSASTISSGVTSSSYSATVSFANGYKYYSFTPSFSGKVRFESTGSADTQIYLYDASGNQLTSNDDGGDGSNFLLTYAVTSGTHYYAKVKFYNSGTGTINFTVKRAYDITYNANGGSGAPAAQEKVHGTSLTLSSTVPTRSGYTFQGWATSSTAASAAYQPGGSFTANADTTLYAVWKANTYTITYNANGGSGAPASQTKTHGVTLTLSSAVPSRSGYTFQGWATSSTAASAAYQPGGSFTSNADTTLYAVWTASSTYTITYNANGGTGAPASQTKIHGVTLTLSSAVPSRSGYTFLGWATSSTAASAAYQPGGSFTSNADTTLYAVWKANTYTITYNANGGSGAPGSQTKTHDVALTLSTTVPTRSGYTFLGWATSSTATSAAYQPGGSFTANADTTLYAVWNSSNLASGSCGTNLTWTLGNTGILTISGSGAMKDYTYNSEMPWYSYRSQIKSVVLENGVTSIGDYAFYGMPSLESIVIPQTVTSIGSYAFKNATALDNVILPSKLSKLGESAFYACTSLTSIEIPASLYTVQPYTFKNCTALAEVTFHEGNLQKISDGAFYNTALTELVLPDCLTILDTYSFKNCSKLSSITLSSNLTQIREAVFYGTAIPTIEIPEGVTSVGPYAFKNCTRLVSIDLPSTLTSVGEASFYECTALESLDLPDAVTKIGNYAFRKCEALLDVSFGSGLENIGESAFYGCESIVYLDIPAKVTTIQAYAFKGCTDLDIVKLPNALTTLGDSAFHTCTSLSEITIPANVAKIGEYCFSGSAGIRAITFKGNAPTIGSGAFSKITATAYYPSGNSTWTASVRQNYGGTITWTAQ